MNGHPSCRAPWCADEDGPTCICGFVRGPKKDADWLELKTEAEKHIGKEVMRNFETGATRNDDSARPDYEGFLSPLVIERFGEYMNSHRKQADGKLRDSDNWQKGIPLNAYIKGLFRHFLHLWQRHRGYAVTDPLAAQNIEEDLCALMFNVQGYLHELLVRKQPININKVRFLDEVTSGRAIISLHSGKQPTSPTDGLYDSGVPGDARAELEAASESEPAPLYRVVT